MARTPTLDGTTAPKAKRGPINKNVFVMFKEGTPSEVVDQFKQYVEELTMNGRVLLRNLSGGTPKQFVAMTIAVEPKKAGEASAE